MPEFFEIEFITLDESLRSSSRMNEQEFAFLGEGKKKKKEKECRENQPIRTFLAA